jgi:hypothetical protein
MNKTKRLTATEWEKELNVRIIKPDGWDGIDFNTPISEAEFTMRMERSTCQFKVENKKTFIKCIVACVNANGEADVLQLKIHCNQDQIDLGQHYDAAQNEAMDQGYEAPMIIMDENEAGGKFLVPLLKWDDVTTVEAYFGETPHI